MVVAEKKYKDFNSGLLKKKLIVFSLLVVACLGFGTSEAMAAAAYANIGVCVQPPDPDLTNPASPIVNYSITINSSNPRNHTSSPFRYYQIQISKDPSFSPILYDTGEKMYGSTFSYVRGSSSDTRPTPRPACDTDSTNVNCPVSFSALAGDPAACYDWYVRSYQAFIGYGECYYSDPWNCWMDGCALYGDDCMCCPPIYETRYANASYTYNKNETVNPMPVGTYSYTVPPGTLPIDNSTYYYRVRVKDVYDWSPYAVGSFFLGATDGVCGTGLSFCDGTTIDPATPGLCVPGAPINISGNPSGPWSWICDGLYGGNPSPQCSAGVASVPSCGTRTACAGDVLSCQPGMCAGGGTCAMTGDTTWTCTNSCGTTSCSAIVQPVESGQCGTADGEPICDGRILSGGELCASGSPSPAAPDTTGYDVSWQCLGSCGGSNESCSAQGRKSCGWIETNP